MRQFMSLLAFWLFLSAQFVLPMPAHAQEKRVALVIGNSDYAHVSSLPNPANDAADMSDALKRLGFAVTLGNDLDYNEMRLMVRDFGDAAADADVVLVYFAGHGIEIDNTNYLIPVNAQLKSDRDVEFETLRLDALMGAIEGSKGVKIVLVDACRNNPFVADMTRTVASRSIGRGLSRIDPGAVLVGYSARGGTVSLDGEGRNSPYAKALLDHIEEPGLEIGKLFRKVRDQVLDTTRGDQEPFTYGSLPGTDIFLVPPVELASAQVPAGPVGPDGKPALSKEEERFLAAKRLGTPRAWALFFRQHPNGRFTREALEQEEVALGFVIEAFATADDTTIVSTVPYRNTPYDPAKVTPEVAAKVDDWLGVGPSETFAIQALLQRIGLYTDGPIDGRIGGKSRAALREFQKSRGLPAHGIVTRATMAALGLPPALEGEDVRPAKSSTYATAQWALALEQLGEDPRVVKAAKDYLGAKQITYGFHGGHAYIAVKNDWTPSYNVLTGQIGRSGGHLVTIASKAENDFVVNLIRYDSGFWSPWKNEWVAGPTIGLRQRAGAPEPRGGWEWVTGEPANYINWSLDMPNNNDGRANIGGFGHHHPKGGRLNRRAWDKWDDYVRTSGAYIIEIE